jgi:predicted AAA+ superfamily ATPase
MPEYIPRILDVRERLASRSHFLFGPRQTGKSTLIRHELPDALVYDLLESDVYLRLSRRPEMLREQVTDGHGIVVIDEIQKIPRLLDEVHLLIEKRGTRFLLTGSSARKMRRGGVNLLGGRARVLTLHPLVRREMEEFDLVRALNNGLMPSIYHSEDPEADLAAYAGTYLREEIAAEGLTRNVPAFSRFLEAAALASGTLVNYSKIASDAQVARSTVQEYFRILEDTLVAYTLPAWKRSVKRKPITTSKFYLFDPGVARHLRNQGTIRPRSPAFGEAFETWLFHELRSYADYTDHPSLAYWRSTSNFEVDFILADRTAIEVKAKDVISARDLRGLKSLRDENLLDTYVLVCLERLPRTEDGIRILPWQVFLDMLWDHAFV